MSPRHLDRYRAAAGVAYQIHRPQIERAYERRKVLGMEARRVRLPVVHLCVRLVVASAVCNHATLRCGERQLATPFVEVSERAVNEHDCRPGRSCVRVRRAVPVVEDGAVYTDRA